MSDYSTPYGPPKVIQDLAQGRNLEQINAPLAWFLGAGRKNSMAEAVLDPTTPIGSSVATAGGGEFIPAKISVKDRRGGNFALDSSDIGKLLLVGGVAEIDFLAENMTNIEVGSVVYLIPDTGLVSDVTTVVSSDSSTVFLGNPELRTFAVNEMILGTSDFNGKWAWSITHPEDGIVRTTGDQSIAGKKTFTDELTVFLPGGNYFYLEQAGYRMRRGTGDGTWAEYTLLPPVAPAMGSASAVRFPQNKSGTLALTSDIPSTSPVALTDAATIATDASLSTYFRVAVAGDRTLAAPTNPTDGQRVLWEITASGADRTLTLATGAAGAFKFSTSITSIPVITSGTTLFLGAVYRTASARWHVLAVSAGN
jgi:hypothetical protein